MRRLQELWMKDLGWKLLSVAIAAIMWFLVINITQPVDTRGYSRTLALENLDTLTERGLALGNEEELRNMKVSVKVKAQRTALDRLSQSTEWLRASLDISALANAANGDTVSIPVDVVMTGGGAGYDIVGKSPLAVEAVVETLAVREIPVTILLNGDPGEDVYLSEPHLDSTSVTVRGPASLVNRVAAVRGFVDAEDIQEETLRVRLAAYDADREVVRGVTTSVSEVTVSYTMYNRKRLAVRPEFVGTPAAGYRLGEVVCTPQFVEVVGSEEALREMDSLPVGTLDVSGRSFTLTRNFRLTEFLPEGISLPKGAEETVRVVAEISAQASREVLLAPEQITLTGTEEGLTYSVRGSVPLTLSGEQEQLDALEEETLRGVVNVVGLSEGAHAVVIRLELPEGLSAPAAYADIEVSGSAEEVPPEEGE